MVLDSSNNTLPIYGAGFPTSQFAKIVQAIYAPVPLHWYPWAHFY